MRPTFLSCSALSPRHLRKVCIGALGVLAFGSPVEATSLVHHWSQVYGDASTQTGKAIAADPSGNVWVTGVYRGTVNFGGITWVAGAGGDEQVFLAKFNSAGTHLESLGFGDIVNSQFPTALATDASGNVVLVGAFEGAIYFGGGGPNLISMGGTDVFVAKFSNPFLHIWSKRFGDASAQIPNGVTIDASGNVLVTGLFQGTIDFGGGGLTSAGSNDIFLAKLDASGNHVWSKRFGDTSSQNAIGIAVDATGNILLTGNFAGSVDFGGGALTSAGSNDIYIAEFTPAGGHVWSKRFGDASSQVGNGVGFDPSGNVLASGLFQGTVDFGGGGLTTAGSNDIYVAKLDGAGNHVWSKRFGDSSSQTPGSVAVDGGGDVVLAGYFAGAVDFGGGVLTSAGGTDIFLARFDNDGNHFWSARYGNASDQHASPAKVDAANNILLTGDVTGTVDFGGGTLTASGEDVFVARFIRPYPEIHAVSDVPGDQGGWARIYVKSSGYDLPTAVPPVLDYHVFRRIDDPALVARVETEGRRAGAAQGVPERSKGSPLLALDSRTFWRAPSAMGAPAAGELWEAVATVPARQQAADYIGLVPTLADSTPSTLPYSVYFVMAQTTTPSVYFDSAPDSGYSVDNLAPATPQQFTGAQSFSPAGLALAWNANTERDLSNYAIYRGSTAGFVPGAGNLVASPSGEAFLDGQWQPQSGYYYKISAIDLHGNESGHALLPPTDVSGIGHAQRLSTYLEQNKPNPFNPTTLIVFGLAAESPVSLRIYDTAGRLVRVLIDGRRAAGRNTETWDGRDDRGKWVGSGVYFYQLNSEGETIARKMILLK